MGINLSMGQVTRRLVTALISAGLLLAWALRATPTEAAFAGMLAGLPLTLALTGAAAIRAARNSGARRPLNWPVVLAGTVATAGYWFRVWSYPGMETWELAGVLVLVYNILGFWWPALFVAMGAWLLEEWLPGLRDATPFGRRLGAGVAAGLAGIILFAAASSAYYEAHDRVPLGADVNRRLGHWVPGPKEARSPREPLPVFMPCEQAPPPPPPVSLDGKRAATSRSSPFPCASPAPGPARPAPPISVPHRLEAGGLTIELDGRTVVQAAPYVALRSLEQAMESARELLKRKDTARVTLVVRAQPGEILRFHAGEADLPRPVWALASLNRGLLRNGGRLDPGSLAAMKEVSVRADLQEFERRIGFQAVADEVRITFTPSGPFNAETAGLYSSAWATANKVLQEVIRYFPDIVRFHIDLPAFQTTVQRSEVRPAFRLQHLVVRPDRILGMMIRRGDAKDHPADPAFHLFDPKSGLQLAVVVYNGPLDSHVPGLLFEEIVLSPGLLYVVGIDADGTVTFLMGDENRLHGPVRVPAAGEKTVDGSVIANLGWMDASRFQRKPQR